MILKGIEYDTFGGGHILVIMPENVKLRCLELRGMPTHLLISIVHTHGGILGPAHPCGEKYMSLCRTRAYKKDPAIVNLFDFVESFNPASPGRPTRQPIGWLRNTGKQNLAEVIPTRQTAWDGLTRSFPMILPVSRI